MDTGVFILLKGQAIEVFTLQIAMREFALYKGLQSDADKLDLAILESKCILSLANDQISELEGTKINSRIGLFESI